MQLMISDEQETLVETVRDWLAGVTDLAEARAEGGATAAGRPAVLVAAADLGLLGLLRADGGGGYVDAGLIVEECGRAASPLPLGHAALACRALDDVGIGRAEADAAAAGRALLVPASAEPGRPPVHADVRPDGTVVLRGDAPYVVAGLDADTLLVSAEGPRGPVLAVVDADAPGLSRQRRTALDISRDFAAVGFDDVPVPAGRWAADPGGVVARLADATAVWYAADAVGAADRLLEMTVRYVGERRQFDRPVGSFQAVKHHCADMALDVARARVAVRAAVRQLDEGGAHDRGAAVAGAAALAGEACSRVGSTALQLHGGMGFTWEHDLHVLLRRVKTDELLGGTPRHHRDRLLWLTA